MRTTLFSRMPMCVCPTATSTGPPNGALRTILHTKLANTHRCCVFTLDGHDLHRVIDRDMLEVLWHDVDCIWTESKYTADGAMAAEKKAVRTGLEQKQR